MEVFVMKKIYLLLGAFLMIAVPVFAAPVSAAPNGTNGVYCNGSYCTVRPNVQMSTRREYCGGRGCGSYCSNVTNCSDDNSCGQPGCYY